MLQRDALPVIFPEGFVQVRAEIGKLHTQPFALSVQAFGGLEYGCLDILAQHGGQDVLLGRGGCLCIVLRIEVAFRQDGPVAFAPYHDDSEILDKGKY